MLITFFVNKFKGRIVTQKNYEQRFFSAIYPAAFCILLFSFGLPFIIKGLEPLLAYSGPIKQFRSIGRFAWVFFYVANIGVFYWLFQKISNWNSKVLQSVVTFLLLGLLLFEGVTYAYKKTYKLYEIPAFYDKDHPENAWMKVINVDNFQAIIPLPFYHFGSENFYLMPKGKTMHHSQVASLQSGLPLVSAFLSRTSLGQTFKILQFIKEPYRTPELINDLPNDKPFLLWLFKEKREFVKKDYQHLVEMATPLYQDEMVEIYKLPIDAIAEEVEKRKSAIQEEYRNKKNYIHQNFRSRDSLQTFVYQDFENTPMEKAYQGNGAFEGSVPDELVFFDGTLPNQQKGRKYNCTVWAYFKDDGIPRIQIGYREFNAAGQQIEFKGFDTKHFVKAIDGPWVLLELPFEVKEADSSIEFKIVNNDVPHKKIYMDDLFIFPQDEPVYLKTKNSIMKNNRWFETNN